MRNGTPQQIQTAAQNWYNLGFFDGRDKQPRQNVIFNDGVLSTGEPPRIYDAGYRDGAAGQPQLVPYPLGPDPDPGMVPMGPPMMGPDPNQAALDYLKLGAGATVNPMMTGGLFGGGDFGSLILLSELSQQQQQQTGGGRRRRRR